MVTKWVSLLTFFLVVVPQDPNLARRLERFAKSFRQRRYWRRRWNSRRWLGELGPLGREQDRNLRNAWQTNRDKSSQSWRSLPRSQIRVARLTIVIGGWTGEAALQVFGRRRCGTNTKISQRFNEAFLDSITKVAFSTSCLQPFMGSIPCGWEIGSITLGGSQAKQRH